MIVVSRFVGRSVGLSVCPHVFSRTVAVVDTKRGYVDMCNGRSAQPGAEFFLFFFMYNNSARKARIHKIAYC